ncbi:PepSY-associated TM helix domain-containing protein [Agaribacterium sp. ZY112]|uniref:PepSY-associated TM helix domain-containing protein n=1 Tax=Agaribacterium sp. ZY112 TaxID=3233574 RepID=UPI0035243910
MPASLIKFCRTVHWISSAIALIGVLFFALTGLTLNHPEWFAGKRSSQYQELQLDEAWLSRFSISSEAEAFQQLTQFVNQQWSLPVPTNIDRDEFEWVMDYQRPGGVSTVVLDLEVGLLTYEKESDGVIALINDLHKGRHSGLVWSLFIDVSAILALVFALSGLVLLWAYCKKRPSTWPLVLAGLAVPLVIYGVFVP